MYYIGVEEQQAVVEVLKNGNLCRYGPVNSTVSDFERGIREKFNTKHALATNGGTASLVIGCYAAGIGLGDEVIVPAYTWVATPASVVIANAVPIIAEIDNSLTIDPKDVEAKITPRTKAIMPVHMIGVPSNMSAILDIAKKYDLIIIEDVAQAIGASYHGKRLGTHGHLGCFSLQQSKIITTGEGGIVISDDQRLADRSQMISDGGNLWGVSAHTDAFFPGMNFRMDEMRGAVAGVQLERLDGFIDNMRIRKQKLRQAINGVKGIELRYLHDSEGDAATTLVFFLPTSDLANQFGESMARHGVSAGPMYRHGNGDKHVYPGWEYILNKNTYHPNGLPYSHPTYGEIEYSDDMCPNTLDYLGRAICIGIHPEMSDESIEKVSQSIKSASDETFG